MCHWIYTSKSLAYHISICIWLIWGLAIIQAIAWPNMATNYNLCHWDLMSFYMKYFKLSFEPRNEVMG